MKKTITSKNIKRFFALIALISMIIMNMNFAKAETPSASITLSASSTEVKPGETINVKIELSNIQTSGGIYSISGLLKYDNTVFEDLMPLHIEVQSPWEKENSTGSAASLKFVSTTSQKTGGTLAIVSFKARRHINLTDDITGSANGTKISFENIRANSIEKLSNVSIKLGGPGVLPGGHTEPVNPITPVAPVVPNVQEQGNNPTPSKNPEAGLDDTAVLAMIALVAVIGLSIYGYKKSIGKI